MKILDELAWSGVKIFAILLFFVVALPVAYFWFNYTDETIIQGRGYGLEIGETKRASFSALKVNFRDIYILYPIDENGYGPHKKIRFEKGDFEILRNKNTWAFYFENGDYSNTLELEFDEIGRLKKVYRHKQPFELP